MMASVSTPTPHPPPPTPYLTQAHAPLMERVQVCNAQGEWQTVWLPVERPLTLYLDTVELVTLLTLGAAPEWLTLGYLLAQGWVNHVNDVASITVDWDIGASAAVRTTPPPHSSSQTPLSQPSLQPQRPHWVTTGCGQGSVYGDWVERVLKTTCITPKSFHPDQIRSLISVIRHYPSLYKQCGSVHACALFVGDQLQYLVEDVGRHNAADTLRGWLICQNQTLQQAISERGILYTTGRLTSEIILKAAAMGIQVVISRSGTTHLAQQLAQQLGLCTLGRALHDRFLCFTSPQTLWPEVHCPS